MTKSKKWKPYAIKDIKPPSPPRPGTGRTPPVPGEMLTGYIGSFKASDLEERTARALDGRKVSFTFRTQFIDSRPPIQIQNSGRNQLGAVEADFVFQSGGLLTAVQIDGQYAHKNATQIEHDRVQDAKLQGVLDQYGGGKIVRIPFYYLKPQSAADNTINALLSGVTDFGSRS